MRWQDHIHSDPQIMMGKPVIRGTRLTVQHILERLGQGATEADLLEAHPRLKPEHIKAAMAYAASWMSMREILLLEEAS